MIYEMEPKGFEPSTSCMPSKWSHYKHLKIRTYMPIFRSNTGIGLEVDRGRTGVGLGVGIRMTQF